MTLEYILNVPQSHGCLKRPIKTSRIPKGSQMSSTPAGEIDSVITSCLYQNSHVEWKLLQDYEERAGKSALSSENNTGGYPGVKQSDLQQHLEEGKLVFSHLLPPLSFLPLPSALCPTPPCLVSPLAPEPHPPYLTGTSHLYNPSLNSSLAQVWGRN